MIVKYAQEHDPELVKQAQAIATKHAALWEPFARIHLIMKYASVMSVERQVELHTKSAEFIKQYFELLEETNKCPNCISSSINWLTGPIDSRCETVSLSDQQGSRWCFPVCHVVMVGFSAPPKHPEN